MKSLQIVFLALFAATGAFGQDCAVEIDLQIISQIESNHNPMAFNPASPNTDRDDSYGRWQVTRVCMEAYNKSTGHCYTIGELYDETINREIAGWYLYQEIPRLLKAYGFRRSIRNKIVCYNAGIGYLVHKKPLPQITQDYIKKYNRLCKR